MKAKIDSDFCVECDRVPKSGIEIRFNKQILSFMLCKNDAKKLIETLTDYVNAICPELFDCVDASWFWYFWDNQQTYLTFEYWRRVGLGSLYFTYEKIYHEEKRLRCGYCKGTNLKAYQVKQKQKGYYLITYECENCQYESGKIIELDDPSFDELKAIFTLIDEILIR